MSLTHKLTALLLILGIAGLFVVCVANVSMMDSNGMMKGVPCGGSHQAGVCPMTLEHLNFWQQLFVATPVSVSLALLLSLIFVVAWGSHRTLDDPLSYSLAYRYSPHYERLNLSFIDYLIEQFSQGILHPKVY